MTIEELKNLVGKNAITYIFQRIKAMKMELEAKINRKSDFSGDFNDLTNKPTKLPNPHALTFTGNATGTYDGSTSVNIEIPTAEGLTAATATKLGGIKAAQKEATDIIPVKIGPDSMLYVQRYPTVYMKQTDKDKLDEFQSADNYALKSEIASVYRYKGTLVDDTLLPENPEVGDTYNLMQSATYGDGANVSWNGEFWDSLGATIDLSSYVQKTDLQEIGNAEIDSIWNTVFGEEA